MADLFHQGRQYQMIRVHCSAISSFHIPLEGVVVDSTHWEQVHEGNIFPETSEAEVLCHLGCKRCFTVIKIVIPS